MMDFTPIYEEDNVQGSEAVIHLVLDDDTEMECVIIAVFPVEETDQEYIALLPIEEDDDEEESEVLLYRYAEDENGELLLDNMESDEEYDLAANMFQNIINEMMEDEEPAE